MSLTNTDYPLPLRLAQVLANPLFARLDTALRQGRHISGEEFELHALLNEFAPELDTFYSRYHVELIKAPEGFYYLRPRATSDIATSVLSELDMLVGKVLCYLYLSPDRLASEGIFSTQDLQEELLGLTDEQQLLRMVNSRMGGSDLDKKKLLEKVRTSLRRLRRLGMIFPVGSGEKADKFRIGEAVFRFAADVRSDEDPRAVQLRLINQGEAVASSEHDQIDAEGADAAEDDTYIQPEEAV
ncbi:MAG: chromosome partition protein MukE [Aeromonas sp.]